MNNAITYSRPSVCAAWALLMCITNNSYGGSRYSVMYQAKRLYQTKKVYAVFIVIVILALSNFTQSWDNFNQNCDNNLARSFYIHVLHHINSTKFIAKSNSVQRVSLIAVLKQSFHFLTWTM